ncbi:hypothetical protein P175DRAFT_0500005 [Aspergillus ochraceoroseus IBT 24754]|uniref:Alpha/beta hydrolase fold-3 domain-containing protein n=3 Tax=Aspergillus subgen. Nidulantes TaxID=2720870 RepID=A0A2T5M4J4_9EURO|nr:uncharacterized protein P175DRAFT_0500005 [Aspergillus ochraceoroseus IBT 24754]KKK16921.1 putative lipase [Aspergillus rambellii]KKK23698.1 putative lipase [Aspergillus ochraceoroseus]PTU23457.1 hypothetical protein P175DRAFT_0500005 [Aspergillus ochraceoroseus IBT 24754]
MASSRWWLLVQAIFWRGLMRVGMFLHNIPVPRPPRASFSRSIPCSSSSSSSSSKVTLLFYCPPDYDRARGDGRRLPVVVNFHGGGFTLGGPSDDSRWAQCIVTDVGAVVVSVGYRRAPEHPFPAAVDDGVVALQYLAAHAAELGLDVSRIAISGFSAGANLAVTVPLRLHELVVAAAAQQQEEPSSSSSTTSLHPLRWLNRAESTQHLVHDHDNIHIVALFCWYPILDFHEPRESRRANSLMPDKALPAFFTDLFDESYLPDLDDRRSPFASPLHASDEALARALPHDIFFFICEWDMLLNEGQEFVRRLQAIHKHVRSMMIEKAPHAWDKSPNPFRDPGPVNILYKDACADMKALFAH